MKFSPEPFTVYAKWFMKFSPEPFTVYAKARESQLSNTTAIGKHTEFDLRPKKSTM